MDTALRSLEKIEFSLIHFQLEFQETYRVGPEAALRLRRDLRRAAKFALGAAEFSDSRSRESFQSLFDPPLPDDPVALKRYQRPGPPFAIIPDPDTWINYEAGDLFDLRIAFWGRGIQYLSEFGKVLSGMGSSGFHRGEGIFELNSIVGEDPVGNRLQIWESGEDWETLAPPICDATWWLSRIESLSGGLWMKIVTPARLISRGRPLFKAEFHQLFPFVLRRVTSMIYACYGVEPISEPARLLGAVKRVEEVSNTLAWHDWRILEGKNHKQDLGGLCGELRLRGEALEEISSILYLGSLMNLGKGAAFGAGCYCLQVDCQV